MGHGVHKQDHTGKQYCDVCSSPLNYNESLYTAKLGYTVCSRFNCRKILSSHKHLPPSMLQFAIDSNKQTNNSWQQIKHKNKQHIDFIDKKVSSEEAYFYDIYVSHLDYDKASHVKRISIPSSNQEDRALTSERIEEYSRHLDKIIESAISLELNAPNSQDEDAKYTLEKTEARLFGKPALSNLSDRFCTICRGGCCAAGNNHAYLSATTILNSILNETLISKQEIKARYLSLLPESVITNSCINHTQTGCALPRELRSDICNGYYCNPLENFQINYSHDDALKILTIQRSSNYWNRYDKEIENKVTGVFEVTEHSSKKINLEDI